MARVENGITIQDEIDVILSWAQRDQQECLECCDGKERREIHANLRMIEKWEPRIRAAFELVDMLKEDHEALMCAEVGSMRAHRQEEPNCSYCRTIREAEGKS